MSIEVNKNLIQNPMKNKVKEEINQSEADAYNQVQNTQAQYDEGMGLFSVAKAKYDAICTQMKYSQGADKTELKGKQKNLGQSLFDRDLNVSCLRDRLQRDLSYYSKMNTTAYIADNLLG